MYKGNKQQGKKQGRIERKFEELRESGQSALVVYITGGDPDVKRSFAVAGAVEEAGGDILELGIPFSDPLADGPVIQAASTRALRAGTTVELLLEGLREFRRHSEIPVVLFTYLNPIFVYGMERFFMDAEEAGADGVLILDLPPEEERQMGGELRFGGLRRIRLVAPTTTEERIKRICQKADGFVYYVSREGVTGEREDLAAGLGERISLLKQYARVPICVGFGISSSEQVAAVARVADGVVVGSAVVRRVEEFGCSTNLEGEIRKFITPLAKAAHEKSF
ncbi:MAG: tryptophan synthase subunit alpha [Chthoniobacterales bacterium]|nr:tryptophan synthase subunit alpha [Chthoniobacterales bacterium]MCX7712676.1 tryptophan synthase subunit alpha [Chthoniobacterales bacterium]